MSINKLKLQNEKLKEYIQLLSNEIEEMYNIARNHGWTSSRIIEGIKLRKEIEDLGLDGRRKKVK
jgi:uncharacterized protein (UPF0335 family)